MENTIPSQHLGFLDGNAALTLGRLAWSYDVPAITTIIATMTNATVTTKSMRLISATSSHVLWGVPNLWP